MTTKKQQRRRLSRCRNEQGSVVQSVLVFPALLFVIMMIIQFALFYHAQSVAEAAAQDGVAVARRADGTQAAAAAAANQSLANLGPKMLSSRAVVATRSVTVARVTVTGKAVTLVPGLTLKVKESAAGPVERYVPESDQ